MEIVEIFANPLDRIFVICASVGTLFFLIRMALSLFGVGDHGGSDGFAGGGDAAVDHAAGDHGEPGFKLLSVQGVTAFFMMFGLVGLALHRGSKVSDWLSVLGALVAGVLMMALMARLMQSMMHLQASGNVDFNEAVGKTGTVYLRIPEGGGTGQVQVEVMSRLMVLDAITKDKEAAKSGDRVEIVGLIAGNTLVVKKV